MKTRILGIALLTLALGCKKHNDQPGNNNVQINNDATSLNSRVTTSDAGVLNIDPTAGGQQRGTLDSSSIEYPMELIASVAPPVDHGDTLRATHVEINGNYAYVSYNTNGPRYKGGIDVFDISSPTRPALVSSVIFPNTDISAIAYYDSKLYVAGAQDATTPAIVGYLQLSAGRPTSTFVTASYNGYVGTGIAIADGKVYLTTGSTGGLYVVSPADLHQLQSIPLADARCVAVNSSYVAVQSGTAGINIYDKSSYSLVRNITLGTDIPESKRTIDFNGNYLFVAAGKGGNRYYDVTTGTKLSEIALPPSISGVNTDDIVTNAVSFNGSDLFFSANGAAGAYLCRENTGTHIINRLGSFGFGIGNSINYVKSKDNYVFIAAGTGGLKIIHITPMVIASCTGLSNYTGSTNMSIRSHTDLQYSGTLLLTSVNIASNSSLYYCGALAISDNSTVSSNSTLDVQGSLSFGSAGKTLTISSNATLRLTGNVVIYGDLVLGSNSNIEFTGTGSTITIYGTVTKGSSVSITGTYTDVNSKL